VVAAMSVAGPVQRMREDLEMITRAVTEAAMIAGRRLGIGGNGDLP
jgi:DNA-binding IclR family transcriptional regulator